MTAARVLILHGFEHHRSSDHWLWWLAEQLRRQRIPTAYPQLPSPDHPKADQWRQVVLAELAMLGEGERIVVTHSLGGILWLHTAASMDPLLRVDRVLLTAPPHPSRLVDRMADFALGDVDPAAALAAGAASTLVVARKLDPYRPGSIAALTRDWSVETVEVDGTGHLNPDDGHGPWPFALEWVLDSRARPQ